MRHTRVLLATWLATLAVSPPLAAMEPELVVFGKRQFECREGEVRFHGAGGTTSYPPGKHEKVRVRASIGMLPYTCQYVRLFVNCPAGTQFVDVRRMAYGGLFEADCLGESVLTTGAGEPGADGEAFGEAPPADGLTPDGLTPDGLTPDGLAPDGLAPDGFAPADAGLTSPP